MKKYLSVILIAFFASACGPAAEDTESTADEIAAARMENGSQVIEVLANPQGFEPSRIALKAGVPARLIFKRTGASSCAETISVPEFGVDKTPLPVGEEVAVEFTPETAGEFAFVCGMEMAEGALVVSS